MLYCTVLRCGVVAVPEDRKSNNIPADNHLLVHLLLFLFSVMLALHVYFVNPIVSVGTTLVSDYS